MVSKAHSILLVLIVSTLLVIQPSTSSTLENQKLQELEKRFNQKMQSYQTKMDADLEKLQAENGQLKSDIKELKTQNAQQDQEIVLVKKIVSYLEADLPSIRAIASDSNKIKNDGASTHKNGLPPSSCQELYDGNYYVRPLDGIHLLKNKDTKKIEAAFCAFPEPATIDDPVLQEFVGAVDVKTKNVHFYAQRNSKFSTPDAIITFDLVRLNEGAAFDYSSGIFTVPVKGIYHFEVSGVKYESVGYLGIYLQVNGANVGYAHTFPISTGSWDTVSLSASLQLAPDDRVNLYNSGIGVLHDDGNHYTHFSGWLVDEDLI